VVGGGEDGAYLLELIRFLLAGIPTFRGSGGLWRKYDAITLATPEAFAENPSLVWQFYHYRREK
jgi:NAD-dependent SIR2 family protein deacetylase